VNVKDEIRVLDEINPESEREAVRFPRVDHFGIRDSVLQCLVIEEVKHVFDCQRKSRTSIGDAKDCLEKIVDVFLQRDLCGQKASQVDLGDHLVTALISIFASVIFVIMVSYQMPHFHARILVANAIVTAVTAVMAPITVVIHRRRSPAHGRTGRTKFGQVQIERFILVVVAFVGGPTTLLLRQNR
jgi:hypothetical protein